MASRPECDRAHEHHPGSKSRPCCLFWITTATGQLDRAFVITATALAGSIAIEDMAPGQGVFAWAIEHQAGFLLMGDAGDSRTKTPRLGLSINQDPALRPNPAPEGYGGRPEIPPAPRAGVFPGAALRALLRARALST